MSTALAERLRLVFFGLRNAGKSSLLNNLLALDVAIVSATPGTTTDPVTRTYELGKLGPVAFTDTAGLDDVGDLGALRAQKSQERLRQADIPILVTRADTNLEELEKKEFENILRTKPAACIVLTHSSNTRNLEKLQWASQYVHALVDNQSGQGIEDFRRLLEKNGVRAKNEDSPLEGLVSPGDYLILVTPIDLAAPKGRLIMPQVETIRDTLDRDCACLVVKERELAQFYHTNSRKPKLVICDSQAFAKVAADIPDDQALTSFSILFARKKGDLAVYLRGVRALEELSKNTGLSTFRVLVLESCAHHQQADDIGSVKIPRLFRQLVQGKAEFTHQRSLPSDTELKNYSVVITCAGCMASRNSIMERLDILEAAGIPIINYGLFLAWANGLLPRAIEAFPAEYAVYTAGKVSAQRAISSSIGLSALPRSVSE